MRHSLRTFCRDERGTLLTTEWAFVATILILGACSWVAARSQIMRAELPAAQRMLELK